MGYYTTHELSIHSGDGYLFEYKEEIAEQIGFNPFQDSIKWYSCDNDMLEFSKKHPDITFCMYGEGEENKDIWYAYFKNGKMFKAKAVITFEEFTEDKLQ
jgi:hypothetical protein